MNKKDLSTYMAKIGAKGGKKSRRKLSKTEAKEMAVKRWNKLSPKDK